MSRMGRFARQGEKPRPRESRVALGEAGREEGLVGVGRPREMGEGGRASASAFDHKELVAQ